MKKEKRNELFNSPEDIIHFHVCSILCFLQLHSVILPLLFLLPDFLDYFFFSLSYCVSETVLNRFTRDIMN